MRRHLASHRGFTLIEISIVITIMMILLSVSAPSLRRFAASSKLRSAAKELRSLFAYARDVAITENEGYLVVFDLDAQEWWLIASSEFDPEDPRAVLTEGVDPALLEANAQETTNTGVSSSMSNTQNQSQTEQTSTSSENTEGMPTRTSMIAKIVRRPPTQVQLAMLRVQHGEASAPQTIQNGIDYVYFSPRGSAEDLEVYLQNQSGKAIRVDLKKETARVTISDVVNAADLGLDVEELR